MPKRSDFFSAVERVLGKEMYQQLQLCGYTPHDFCREVAQIAFIGGLKQEIPNDLDVIRVVAKNLWSGDGTTGFVE